MLFRNVGLSIGIQEGKDGITEIMISPQGDKEKFVIVKSIIAKAPQVKGWKIIGFRQPIGFDFTLELKDIKLRPKDLYFYLIFGKNPLDIIIYGKNFNEYDPAMLWNLGTTLMQFILGEYDFATAIGHYEFKDISEIDDKNDFDTSYKH